MDRYQATFKIHKTTGRNKEITLIEIVAETSMEKVKKYLKKKYGTINCINIEKI